MFELSVKKYQVAEPYQELGGDHYEANFFLASIAISLKRIADAQERQNIPNFNIAYPLNQRSDTIC